jgi:GNAT superfamily N-acetyltransferase
LFVLPKYRREGIGGALLIAAARWLVNDGIARATVDCFAKDPTRTFFDRLGGVVIASNTDEDDPAAMITYGFANLKELAAKG